MPRIDAVVSCPVHDSFRVQQVAGLFDLPLEKKANASFSVEVPSVEESWQLGVIVGPSGSGKSTIARTAFGEALAESFDWPSDRAVIDGFGEHSIKEITRVLTAVGFSSPPAWIKPYAVLSNGERFRCDLARMLLADRPLVVCDEFTSVVDRTVARFGSAAVSKAIRSGKVDRRFVAVTCHYDVLEWLEPDWVVDMAVGELKRRCLRRPRIELELVRCQYTAWRLFRSHHYLSGTVNRAAHCYLATWNGEPVAFCAILALPGRRGHWRVSRIVVLPDYQGIGIGRRVLDALARHYQAEQRVLHITTSHPAMIAALAHSPDWAVSSVKKTGFGVQRGARTGKLNNYVQSVSQGRAVVSFRYTSAERERLS